MAPTKFLVNGQPMTNEEYVALLAKAREAQTAYKQTPQYKAEQEKKELIEKEAMESFKKVEDYIKTLKLSSESVAKIALKLYNANKPTKE